MGFSRTQPWFYLSGDNPELLDVYPELGYLRDIVYLLKAFMAPTSDALPEVCAAAVASILHIRIRQWSSGLVAVFVYICDAKCRDQRWLRSCPVRSFRCRGRRGIGRKSGYFFKAATTAPFLLCCLAGAYW